jgi:hypothetical protein
MLEHPAKTPLPEHGTNTLVCSMEVSDFDKVAEKIGRLGGQSRAIEISGARCVLAGYVLDLEGNFFGIFERARAAKLKDLVNAEGIESSKPDPDFVDGRQMHANHGSAAGITILPEMPKLVAHRIRQSK